MTHDAAPAADTSSHSHTDTSFADTSHTSHNTWSAPSHHEPSHTDPGHSHHGHHHHHHHHHHHADPLIDTQAPPSYGSIINERDGRLPIQRRQELEDYSFMEAVGFILQGVIIIGIICCFVFIFSKIVSDPRMGPWNQIA